MDRIKKILFHPLNTRVWGCVFLFAFALLFGGIVALDAPSLVHDMRRLMWKRTPCTIVQSKVGEGREGGYVLRVKYAYEFGGKSWVSERYTPDCNAHALPSIAERLPMLRFYREGAQRICYVDPTNPQYACLQKEIAPVWTRLFTDAFVLVVLCLGSLRKGVRLWRDPKEVPPSRKHIRPRWSAFFSPSTPFWWEAS